MSHDLADIPLWKQNLPLLVLSTLLLVLGSMFFIAALNLPLPATDHLDRPQQLLMIGFGVMTVSLGSAFIIVGLGKDRWILLATLLLGLGVAAMMATMSYSIYLYPYVHAAG